MRGVYMYAVRKRDHQAETIARRIRIAGRKAGVLARKRNGSFEIVDEWNGKLLGRVLINRRRSRPPGAAG
jgi:hypothetical protein